MKDIHASISPRRKWYHRLLGLRKHPPLTFTVSVPETVEEFDQLAGKPESCFETLRKHADYLNAIHDYREAVKTGETENEFVRRILKEQQS